MSKGLSGTPDTLLSKALLLLDELKLNEVDAVVSEHLRAVLVDAQHAQQDITSVYTALLHITLSALASRVAGNDPVLEKQIRMVMLRMTPPLSGAELKTLQDYTLTLFNRVEGVSTIVPASTMPLDLSETVQPGSSTKELTVAREVGSQVDVEVKEQFDAAMRDQLDQKNQEFTQIRTTLSRHVNEAIAQNQEFGVLLEVELDELYEAERIQDIEKRRLVLINEINKFVKKHRLLTNKFDSASKYLNLVDSSNQHLSDELDRARQLSLTDELTGLPNRRAFLRRMEDEAGRMKRYGIPVSIAIIDLDEFKAINDLWGHGGGDAVLRSYAKQILSGFRHHDMVARYGGEEFSVILPNTKQDGAVHALQKVQNRVSEAVCVHHGERFSMPTFSAGLAEYHPGESLSDFIERADTALYRAKKMGRNRIEIADEPRINIEANGEPKYDFNAARHA